MTMMPPSSTSTFDSMERLLVVAPLGSLRVESSIFDTSWYTASLTVPFSLICGRTLSTRPTSLRSTVLNGFTVPLVLVALAYEPLRKGTLLPMRIFASSLSRVSRLGVESTLASPLFCRKLASAPR